MPLSLQHYGVYHGMETVAGKRLLLHERPWWRLWQHGDQLFLKRPGDRLYGFAQIFAPTEFKDRLFVRWAKKVRGSWLESDAIPITITGARKEGYRGHTVKQNFDAGEWRAEIETDDGRAVGSIHLTVVDDPPGPDGTFPPRVFKVDIF